MGDGHPGSLRGKTPPTPPRQKESATWDACNQSKNQSERTRIYRLFTMTNAATGHALHGKGRGWRKAVRFALTENPAADAKPVKREDFFSLVQEGEPRGI